MRFKHLFALVFALLTVTAVNTSHAQIAYQNLVFNIDSLTEVGRPKSALAEVKKLDQLARKNQHTPYIIRAVIYRMGLLAYLEEDALNTIIAQLKTDIQNAGYPAKPVLQSLLAAMYWEHYKTSRWNINRRTRLDKPDADITRWDMQTIVAETDRMYRQSLQNSSQLQNTSVGVLNGVLAGDSATRYLRPALYDMLVHRALEFYLDTEIDLPRPRSPFNLANEHFFSDSRTFAGITINSTDTTSLFYRGLLLLQQATAFHLQKSNTEALADLDLKRLQFLHSRLITPSQNKLYLNSLQQFVQNYEGKAIAADGLVLLGKYYQEKDSLVTALDFFDKAIKLYPKSLGGQNAAVAKNDIKEHELGITVENINAADKPLLALINYRNVNKANIAVYKFTPAQQARLQKMNASWYNSGLSKTGLKYLQSIKPVESAEYVLPDPHDYRKHSAEIKLNALPVGSYHILITHAVGNKALNTLVKFTVTNLAYVMRQNPNGAHELRVMDRYSGKPLKDVAVNISRTEYRNNKDQKIKVAAGITDGNGRFLFGREGSELTVDLRYKGDIFIDDNRYVSGNLARETSIPVIKRSILFTDRQIYRPGQTVYFKLLQLQNQGDSSIILPKQSITVNLFDANGKKVTDYRVVTNEFGTASGSFILPQNSLNGTMYIRTDNGSVAIQVEEYKRPTFEIEFLPVDESYRLNDSVTVKGVVKAFAGYGIANAKVAYDINRHFNIKSFDTDIVVGGEEIKMEQNIATDTVTTDSEGRFSIRFKAADMELTFPAVYEYTVKADVTDAAGETHMAGQQVKVSSNPLLIDVLVPQLITVNDDANIKIKLNNANGQPLDGTAQVKIYKLQAPRTVFKNRLWAAPDLFIMKRDEFIKYFPAYAYHNEDVILTWAKTDTVASWNMFFDKTKLQTLSLGQLFKQASGAYEVVVKARTPRGDTATYVQQVIFTNQPGKLQRHEDWVTQVKTTVKPGQPAEFLIGTDAPCNVLIEKYDGAKLLSSEWLKLNGPLQQSIKVSFPVRNGEFNVQFLMINNNRVYSSYQGVTIKDTVETLPLKFLTFRNKLQPGEKEQWKIQVGNGESPARMAEMVATLYDASLDNIQPPAAWAVNSGTRYGWPVPYFSWDINDFVSPEAGIDQYTDGGYLIEDARNYEELHLFDYDYYGGYNNAYHNKNTGEVSVDDLKLNKLYIKNAALVKNGFDAVGRVVVNKIKDNYPVVGAKITIPNTKIFTRSNSLGYFKIKVPAHGQLLISSTDFVSRTVTFKRGQKLIIPLQDKLTSYEDLKTADPGQKDIKGDPTHTIRIDEPVGNAPVSAAVAYEDNALGVKGDRYMSQVRFPAPVIKADGEILKKVQIVNDYGNQTTKHEQVTIRKNFNETAFFYPQLHTDEKGHILIDFTIPESLTKWHFKAFAHTQKLVTGYIEQEIVTQKQLMVSANMPRFMREGDTITVSARVVNLSAQALDGKVQLKLYNALNMQPVELLAKKTDGEQGFKIEPGTNQAIAFKLIVPANLDAITYRLTAVTGKFNDGEENTIPVLPNRILVTESMPMMVRAGQTRSFTFDKLINHTSKTLINKSLTLEYTDNPAWYAVQAMPYLMEFPYECSEQTFSRYFANSLSAAITNRNPQIKQVFDAWKTTDSQTLLSNLEQNPELKATLLEETPWLQDAASESEQKKRIALLFDLNKLTNEQNQSLEKLQKKQLGNGGFPWFGGNHADRYITQHIIAGIGQLNQFKAALNAGTLKNITSNALRYLNDELLHDDEQQAKIKDYATRPLSALEIHAWYARSYFTGDVLTAALNKVQQQYLNRAAQQWLKQSIYQQALIALTMHRAGKTEVAQSIISSLTETAQQSNEAGMYWAKNQLGWYWYQSPVETQALLIELFTEAGNNTKAVEEMKIWLLRSKQTTNWRTTKATASACYALLMKGDNLLTQQGNNIIKLNGQLITQLKPNIKKDAGTSYLKTSWVDEQVKPEFGKVEITNNAKTLSWGAMHWQYTERSENVTASATDITLERKYFIQKQDNNGRPVLVAVDASHAPKTGDLLKVVVYLKAARDFEYVQLKDMRPACTEPVDVLSAYKYQDGLWYYQVTKDVATNFFISQLTKGSYVFEYELRVAQPGSFATGISTIQCMYAPEFNAHSKGGRVRIK